MFTEDELLKLLRIQSNLGPKEFCKIFGENRGRSLFQSFSRLNWNLVSFMFNSVNGDDRKNLIEYVNNKIKQLN